MPCEPLQKIEPRRAFRRDLGVRIHRTARQLANVQLRAKRVIQCGFLLEEVQNRLVALVAERLENGFHFAVPVGGQDADSIAGRVVHAIFQRQLDVARLLLGVLVGQDVVHQHGRREGGIACVLLRFGADEIWLFSPV